MRVRSKSTVLDAILERRTYVKLQSMRWEQVCLQMFKTILPLVFLTVAYPAEAQEELLPPSTNPLQVATLHWYAANQTAQFPLGGGFPTGTAFDGENLWVGNVAANILIKLRPSDGAILATYPAPDPYSIAYDGANVWTTDCNGLAVTKIRPTDGTILGSFPTGGCRNSLAFDGTNIWVAAATSSSCGRVMEPTSTALTLEINLLA